MKRLLLAITRDDLEHMVQLAEAGIILRNDDHSDRPDERDRAVMLRMWAITGKTMPSYFRSEFGWVQESRSEGGKSHRTERD